MLISKNDAWLSDAEVIYLYQENYQTRRSLLHLMFFRYQIMLSQRQRQIYCHFYHLPFELDDLNWLQYVTITAAVVNFQNRYNKSFKNYLVALFTWRVKNEIRRCWNKATVTTSQTVSLERLVREKPIITAVNNHHHWEKVVLNRCVQFLTPLERTVIQMRMSGYNTKEVIQRTNLKYRQVDNALQRSVQKLKLLVNKNWLA